MCVQTPRNNELIKIIFKNTPKNILKALSEKVVGKQLRIDIKNNMSIRIHLLMNLRIDTSV